VRLITWRSGHRIKGGPPGRRFEQTFEPASTHTDLGAYEQDGQE
jgi:hypothetical protein